MFDYTMLELGGIVVGGLIGIGVHNLICRSAFDYGIRKSCCEIEKAVNHYNIESVNSNSSEDCTKDIHKFLCEIAEKSREEFEEWYNSK